MYDQIFITTAQLTFYSIGCPAGFPYAYADGAKCCFYPQEDDDREDDPHCNGEALTMDSSCCLLESRSDKWSNCDENDSGARCIDAPIASMTNVR